jgi:SWI/SNF-related matrix-associated actin-dependent regulator of chromatin subfamily A-like protein 1
VGRSIILRPFQEEGVEDIYYFGGRALVADEMGLGKTIEALEWVDRIIHRHYPVVVVTTASMKYAWQMEARKFGLHAEVIEGTRPPRRWKFPADIIILNYHILSSWVDAMLQERPRVCIFDEIHYLKNPQAQRTIAAMDLVRYASSVVGLSGTPMTKRPIELWSVLQVINPDIFPDRFKFAWRYCKPKFVRGEWKFNGADRRDELNDILYSEVMIRRLKKDVAKDLPDKVRRMVPCKLPSYREYNEARYDFLNWLGKKSPARAYRARKNEALVKVGYLLRLVAELRLDWTVQWLKEFEETHPGEKLVGLTMHTKVIKRLEREFPNCVVIDGSVTGIDRMRAQQAFQTNHKIMWMFGNWQAAGEGITATAARYFAGLDPTFTPGRRGQGEDRIHRIGQDRDCTMFHLYALNTIEEKYFALLDQHQGWMTDILDGPGEGLIEQLLNE